MSDKYQQLSINWNDIGVTNTPEVRDVWRQQNLGTIKNKYSASVPPHGVKLIRIKK
jgi:alpha-galactosidase